MTRAANARVHQSKLFYKTQESINRKFLKLMPLIIKHLKGHYDDQYPLKTNKQLFIEKSEKVDIFLYFDISKSRISKYR